MENIKYIITVFVLALGFINVNAQSKSTRATVSITLSPVQSLMVNVSNVSDCPNGSKDGLAIRSSDDLQDYVRSSGTGGYTVSVYSQDIKPGAGVDGSRIGMEDEQNVILQGDSHKIFKEASAGIAYQKVTIYGIEPR